MPKIVIITSCYKCPYFDNEYYSYRERCTELERQLTDDEQRHFPEDCPLKDSEES